ncbi:hypothetical protein [Propionivibrio sp.]|uniref:hypothetical protein n=1 Tax=Propionivibrio sp. TaxID=2212460 RepID=UPI0026266485|nr:hypothetical protein [Propionivibrio sp.]
MNVIGIIINRRRYSGAAHFRWLSAVAFASATSIIIGGQSGHEPWDKSHRIVIPAQATVGSSEPGMTANQWVSGRTNLPWFFVSRCVRCG